MVLWEIVAPTRPHSETVSCWMVWHNGAWARLCPGLAVWPYKMRGDSDSVLHSQGLMIHARRGQGCVWGSAQPWKILLESR